MIRGTAKVVDEKDVIVEVTVRMTVEEWRLVQNQLSEVWPSYQFARLVRNALENVIGRVEQIAEVAG